MFNEFSDVLTVDEVSKALCIGKSSAYKIVNSHIIGSIRVGKKILIPKVCLIDFVQSARYKTANCNSSLSGTF